MIFIWTSYSLRQLNYITNYRDVCLDLILSSIETSEVVHAPDVLLEEDRHHPALSFEFEVLQPSTTESQKRVLNFRRCDVDAVFNGLQVLSYPASSELADPERAFTNFSDYLASLVRVNTPLKRVGGARFPSWFSKKLKLLVIRKKQLHKVYKHTRAHIDYDNFRRTRRECRDLTHACYSEYIGKVENGIPRDIKSFWSHVGSLKSSPNVPTHMTLDKKEATDPTSKCDLFARYFSSVFSDTTVPIPRFDYGWNQTLSSCSITTLDVQQTLESLDARKSAGPDDIPPRVLKQCAPILAVHLTILFRPLLASGVFPSNLKQSYVIPIFKSRDRGNIRDYRPIVIQSALAKVFESIILNNIYSQLKSRICLEQHGFLKGRSTTTNLLMFQEYIMSAFANSSQVDCIYLDFSKAFDKINHSLLISKLEGYGIWGPLLRWMSSYLRERTLIVKYDGGLHLLMTKRNSNIPLTG
ncbi:uncharacterized protein LOC124368609 [Homalodisca vitripennis]|uniref:uncharacterized protein LOC124368609 n=1 Tax=Homalodisca vitripennis TaxID=197043 RepID=UPI001EEA7C96|nr:uncharacterized protein LOC124368609 [Homalodisca vitripennis]